jgi:putative endonuclease
MFTVYVLYSVKFDKIYIGFTSDLDARVNSHNFLATKGFTVKYRPWAILYTEVHAAKAGAMKREKALKSATGRAFIWSLIKNKFSATQ